MQQEVKVTTNVQTAIPELGRAEKIMYYLIIGEGEKKVVINIGKSKYDEIKALTEKQK